MKAMFLRTITLPTRRTEAQTRFFLESLHALRETQQILHSHDDRIAVIEEIQCVDDECVLHYPLDDVRSLGSMVLGERPSPQCVHKWAINLCEIFCSAVKQPETTSLFHGGVVGASILIGPGERLYVLDFGVASCFIEAFTDQASCWLEQVASNVAPERWNKPALLSETSDVFGIGILLYELCTGQHPFGAIRDDPDDCKYQILTELPVPPRQREPSLSPEFSNIIFRAIRTEASKRYSHFHEMKDALSCCQEAVQADPSGSVSALPETLVPEVEDPKRSETGPTHVLTPEEEESRLQYLREQEELKKRRETAAAERTRQQEQRDAQLQARKERRRRFVAAIRRHAVAFTASVVCILLAFVIVAVYLIRFGNHRDFSERLEAVRTSLNAEVTPQHRRNLESTLNAPDTAGRLSEAIAELHEVDASVQFEYSEIQFAGWLHEEAHTSLVLAEQAVPVVLVLANEPSHRVKLSIDESELLTAVNRVVERIALSRLEPPEVALMDQLSQVFNRHQEPEALEHALKSMTFDVSRVDLGYLAFRSDQKHVQLETLKPIPGQDAVRADVTLRDRAGDIIVPDVMLALRLAYHCQGGACSLAQAAPMPAEEPAGHKSWCILKVLERIQEAVSGRELEALSGLGVEDVDASEDPLAWVRECRSAELEVDSMDLDHNTVRVAVRYQPGLISDHVYRTIAFELIFDPQQWRVSPLLSIDWPTTPLPLLRQRQGAELVSRFRRAWESRDAKAYRSFFPGTRYSESIFERMFERIAGEERQYDIWILEDPESRSDVFIQIAPLPEALSSDERSSQPTTLRFTLVDGGLRWDGRTDPLWSFNSVAYQTLLKEIETSGFNKVSELKSQIARMPSGQISSAQQEQLNRWIASVESARMTLEPLSDESVAGFPQRARLKNTPEGIELNFHLVLSGKEIPQLLYVLDREVRVDDVIPYWRRANKPWEQWGQIVGPAPDGQVVGLSVHEAKEIAARYQCRLPTLQEWQDAAGVLGHDSSLRFHGGVWEWCYESSGSEDAVIVGGCWLDYDPQVQGIGVPEPPVIGRQGEGFGTIGFRICMPLEAPGEVLARYLNRATLHSHASEMTEPG